MSHLTKYKFKPWSIYILHGGWYTSQNDSKAKSEERESERQSERITITYESSSPPPPVDIWFVHFQHRNLKKKKKTSRGATVIPLTFTVLNRCQGFFHCKASPYVQPLSCALTCSYWHTKRFSIFRSVGRDSPCRLMSSIRFTTESLKVIQPTEPSKTASNTTTLQSANKYGNPSFQTWAQAWKNTDTN